MCQPTQGGCHTSRSKRHKPEKKRARLREPHGIQITLGKPIAVNPPRIGRTGFFSSQREIRDKIDIAKICLYTKSTLIGGVIEFDNNAVDIEDSETLPKTGVPQPHGMVSGGGDQDLAIIGRRGKLLAIRRKRHGAYSIESLLLISRIWALQSHGLVQGSRGELLPVE